MKNLILATIISSSLLIADNGVALPEYDLVKKDFINGEINNERVSQIILKDPRLVPKSRGGLKDDVDASSDGLGVLVIGKILNGSVDSIELKNDNSNINNKLNYLIKKYGDDAKSAGMSTIDYVKDGVQTGIFSGAEAETIQNNLSRDDIVSVSLTSSNNIPLLSSIITINSIIIGNDGNSPITYNWSSSSSIDIQSQNDDNIIISFNKSGESTLFLTASNNVSSKTTSINFNIDSISVESIDYAYDNTPAISDGKIFITDLSKELTWNGSAWVDETNTPIYPQFNRDNSTGIITDSNTGLMWASYSGGRNGAGTYPGAIANCSLNGWVGYSDWRLASTSEISNIFTQTNGYHFAYPGLPRAFNQENNLPCFITIEFQSVCLHKNLSTPSVSSTSANIHFNFKCVRDNI